ncbi:MAG: HAD hydrolase-like protein [Deltaproteobacteria bacterium]
MILYLFDIDGTLLDAHGSGRGAFDDVMAELHGVNDASAGIRYGGKTDHAIVDEIFRARLGRSAEEAERATFLAAYVPKLTSRLQANGVIVLHGAVAALDYLAGKARLGVATGNIREGADAKLSAAGLAGRFELGGYGCDAIVRADLVARAIDRARETSDVSEVIVVGDTVHDITAARACGATVCAVATGSDSAEALAHADVVFRSLAELPAWHEGR